jgi:hypothetical protein
MHFGGVGHIGEKDGRVVSIMMNRCFALLYILVGTGLLVYNAVARAEDEEKPKAPDYGNHGRITVSPGVGFGDGAVVSLDVKYYYTDYIAFAFNGYYRTRIDDNQALTRTDYGPEIAAELLLPNPSIFTPFIGAGPGFQRWTIRHHDETFDDASSLTLNAFGGVDMGLTRVFGLVVGTKTTYYVNDPPRVFPDREKHEPKSYHRLLIGFRVTL